MASSSGRQPTFAALNRGHHLCSAGRPSGWALAHILALFTFLLLHVNACSTSAILSWHYLLTLVLVSHWVVLAVAVSFRPLYFFLTDSWLIDITNSVIVSGKTWTIPCVSFWGYRVSHLFAMCAFCDLAIRPKVANTSKIKLAYGYT